MSAKPTESEPEKHVDEVAKQLSETKINEDNDAKSASKKADKKARQKAKKDAMKAENESENPNDDKKIENPENSGDKSSSSKNKKKNKSKGKSGGGSSGAKTQTDPPSVPISELFPNGNYPEGQIMDHPIANDDSKAKDRFTSEEARALDRAQLDMYNEIR